MTNEVKNAVNLIKEYLALDKDIEGNEYLDSLRIMVQALESQPSKDCISRESLKQKLQEEHDFFVNAYGGNFKDMPYEEKVRVDEITNCIAIVVNEPSVYPERPKGKWIKCKSRFGVEYFECSECGRKLNWIDRDDNYCNDCGSDNSESTKEWFKERDTKLTEMTGGEEDED